MNLTLRSQLSAKRGRPLLIGETLDKQMRAYIRSVWDCGGPISSLIAIAVGRNFDASMLAENDGPLCQTTN